MKQAKRLHTLMDSTNGVLFCLFIFVLRASITVWSTGGLMTRTYCVLAGLACIAGVATNTTARKLLSYRSSN
jgi:uncharacterized membrane protein